MNSADDVRRRIGVSSPGADPRTRHYYAVRGTVCVTHLYEVDLEVMAHDAAEARAIAQEHVDRAELLDENFDWVEGPLVTASTKGTP